MGPRKITLFVDVVSPFVYEAFHVLRNDAVFRDVEITYVPIFLGGLMHACGNRPPIQIKNKDTWIDRERVRWARTFGVPMRETTPPNFPPNTMHVMRVLCAIESQDDLVRALEALFRAFWTEHATIAEPDVFAPLLRETLGQAKAEKALAAAATTGKETLRANTDAAFAAGAFGLPWMLCTDRAGQVEGFWGVDHLGQVRRFLALERPPDAPAWKAVL
ncbi:HCCA isomerase/glutathione S-transferase kappa [Xylariaceae sp. FL0804]|nr:HCCA isomerase/glutathione S-transferase kappa [Xylariaceae sp. FL0804]